MAFKYFIFVVADTRGTNIMAPVKRKLDTSDTTKIQKKTRSKSPTKRNENTILLEELACEAILSSQIEVEFSQKEYEKREIMRLLMMEKDKK